MRQHHSNARAIALAGCLAVAALACAERTASAPPPAAATAAAPTANKSARPPEIAWADMNKEQRLEYMKTVVAPQMKQAFVNFSPDRYGRMNCVTCHGDSATEGSFKMPNPKLPKLPATADKFQKLAAERPAITEFMKNVVKPRMAVLLGDRGAPKPGFGCMECHTTTKAQ
jgi:hypothetical protein